MDWTRVFLILGTLLVVGWPQVRVGLAFTSTFLTTFGGKAFQTQGRSFLEVPAAPLQDGQSRGGKVRIATCTSGQFLSYANEVKAALEAKHALTAAVTLLGPSILQALGLEDPPAVVMYLHRHKFAAIGLSWIASSWLNKLALTTGAFEVYFDGHLLHSRLAQGALPTIADLVSAVGRKLAFQ
eukprot:jgi/Mesen1/1485/ME000132S00431